jgi:hypothetical protein
MLPTRVNFFGLVTFSQSANLNRHEVVSSSDQETELEMGPEEMEQIVILITCADVRRELSNYIEEDVSAELRSRIEQHVSGCPGCKALYDGVRNILTLVSTGEIIPLPRGFSARLYRRLYAAETSN